MDVKAFLETASVVEIASKIVELAVSEAELSIDELRDFLLVRDGHTYDKFVIPQLVSRALLHKGERGVQTLVTTLNDAPGSIYPTAILGALWHAARQQQAPIFGFNRFPVEPPLDDPISNDTALAAREAFHDVVVESQNNEELFNHLMSFLQQATFLNNVPNKGEVFRSAVFEIFAETTIKLTQRLIMKFKQLVEEVHPEEVYQDFLSKNPVLIDPIANQILEKQKLGIEFITDFVIRRLDNEYVLVEIEKPYDNIFTNGNNFTAKFNHALGQVLDFQEWVDQHGEYARTLMPGISSPRGLLIMGRRASLSVRQVTKLKRYCLNLHSIEILTFDDLIIRAQNFYDNLHADTRR